MEPDEFIARDAFESLTEPEQFAYLMRLMATALPMLSGEASADSATRIEYATHYMDVMEWVLPEEDYTRLVRVPLWNVVWEDAELMVEILTAASLDPDLDEAERLDAVRRLESATAILEHKRELEKLDEPEK